MQHYFYGLSNFLLFQIDNQGENDPLTALVVNLDGVDPDDAFSVVPYEKGSTFLWYLEDTVGGPGMCTNKYYYGLLQFLNLNV